MAPIAAPNPGRQLPALLIHSPSLQHDPQKIRWKVARKPDLLRTLPPSLASMKWPHC